MEAKKPSMKFYSLVNRSVVEVDIADGGKFMESRERIVAQTNLTQTINGESREFKVSTVFIFTDHGYSDSDSKDPVVFETMVFEIIDGKVKMDELMCERYRFHDEAFHSHIEIVREIYAGRKTFPLSTDV